MERFSGGTRELGMEVCKYPTARERDEPERRDLV